jgi:broad specificity phosphatase PhoE
MKLLFLRHAQGTHNSDAVRRGSIAYFDPIHTDASLDDVGLQQTVAQQQEYVCDYIYCSPLKRCRDTLLRVMPVSSDRLVRLDDRLMETQGRAFCNRRSAKSAILESVPAMWDTTQIAEQNPHDLLVEHQSHSPAEMPKFQMRIKEFTEELLANHDDSDTILLVGHHDWIRTWFWLYKGADVSPENCETMTADI